MANYGRGGRESEAVLRSSEDDLPPSALAWPARGADSRVPGAGVGAEKGGPVNATIRRHVTSVLLKHAIDLISALYTNLKLNMHNDSFRANQG